MTWSLIYFSPFATACTEENLKHSKGVVQKFSVKKLSLKILNNVEENICTVTLVSNKVAGLRPATIAKGDFGAGDFLGNLRTFKDTFFARHLGENV